MTVNTLDQYHNSVPQINGILWQVLLNNVPLRRPWDSLGAGKTLIQWIAVDGYSFVENPWLPTYNIQLDMDELATYPFASEIILGTPGYFSEVTSRSNLPLMADLAQKFATLDWPENVKGYYFPVEIDPTWVDAKAQLAPLWSMLPRPLYISAYYGEGINGAQAARWLNDLLPSDVHLLFQDGSGAFNVSTDLAKERLGQLETALGKHRVSLIAEVFKENPDWDGTPGEFYIPLTAEEYRTRIGAYQGLYNENRLWVFDGPNYIKNTLIDTLQGRPSLAVPTGLRADMNLLNEIVLSSDSFTGPEHGRKYTVYDSSGNSVIREYFARPGESFAIYPTADYLEDYNFAPTFIVFDAMSIRNRRYNSDRSELYAGAVNAFENNIVSTVSRSNWGDVAIKATVADSSPSDFLYYFDIFHPGNASDVLRTIIVDGSTAVDSLIRADYPNELNVPDSVFATGAPSPWINLKWRLRSQSKIFGGEPYPVGLYQSTILEDNASFVKKTILLGINSLVGGYFNDLSDPLNPGGTGNPGRKDVVAAHTFRETFAQIAGLNPIEVMPVMTVVGSSPINPMPYQAGFDQNNYWWNATTNSPGPNLVYANGIVQSLNIVPDYFVESGPGETTGLAFAAPGDRPAILAAWRTSNIAMLNWMRTNWGNPTLEIWFQSATTSWWGEGVPVNVNAECTQLVRELQQSMALEGIGFKFGSYVPNSNKYTAYRNEMSTGIGWVHYSVDAYHAAAAEMATSMATDTNQALNPPAWTSLRIVEGFRAKQQVNNDIKYSWTARPGVTAWKVKNKRADTKAIISEDIVSSAEFTFTAAQQMAVYTYTTNYIVCEVQEYLTASSDDGPPVEFNLTAEPSGLLAPTGLAAHIETNSDVTMSWTGRPGITAWYFKNLRADTMAVISEGVLTSPVNIFTVAQQMAAYTYTVGYVIFEVQEYDSATSTKGPSTQFNGSAT